MDLKQAEQHTILKILAGSHIHGLAIPTSDRDEEAIVVEPLEDAMGFRGPFEELIREKVLDVCVRKAPLSMELCVQGTKDCVDDHTKPKDVKYVSLRKWCRLALKGNPNFLLALFAPQESILSIIATGGQLRELAPAFISKRAIGSHLGYLQGQRHRMLSGSNGGRGKPRQDKIDEFGFDTKYAMHLIRLALQGVELTQTGKLTLPIAEPNRSYLLAIRGGEVPLKDVLSLADELEAQMKRAFDTCSLPEEPDYKTVQEFMLNVYIRKWSAAKAHQDILADAARFEAHRGKTTQTSS
jgi:predicted nucleotidyltransferase